MFKKILVFTGLALIVTSYQNCGGFDAAGIGGLNQSSVGGGNKTVTLVWDRTTNNEDDSQASIRGYKLYVGTASEEYTNTISESKIGDVTEYSVSGLNSGETYYFSVAAVSDDGVESEKSSEISYEVP